MQYLVHNNLSELFHLFGRETEIPNRKSIIESSEWSFVVALELCLMEFDLILDSFSMGFSQVTFTDYWRMSAIEFVEFLWCFKTVKNIQSQNEHSDFKRFHMGGLE